MAKHLTQSEIKKAILDEMCRIVDDNSISIGFRRENFHKMLPDGVRQARFDLAFRKLLNAEDINYNGASYELSGRVYEEYVGKQDAEKSEEPDPWGPITVENHEEVAGKIEEFSAEIKAENGLRVSHPDETEFVTETADATAKSLRDKEGVITRKRLSTVIEYTYKILKICDITTRIGEMASALIKFLTSFLS